MDFPALNRPDALWCLAVLPLLSGLTLLFMAVTGTGGVLFELSGTITSVGLVNPNSVKNNGKEGRPHALRAR